MSILSGFEDENFANYRKPSMTIGFPSCTFKCGEWCQNYQLKDSKRIRVDDDVLVDRYVNNGMTHAIVMAGLDPMDSFRQLERLVMKFRERTDDDIVIYTGYDENEVVSETNELKKYDNIFIKYGRYIPNADTVYDDVLGVELASDNQYAVKIS